MSFVTVRGYNDWMQAQLVKTKLENEGIQCFLYDENMALINPLFMNMLGGISVKVHELDAEKARLVIHQFDTLPVTDEQDQVITCPKCGSNEYLTGFKSFKSVKGVLSLIVSFLFLVLPIYQKSVKKCTKCGHEFE